MQEIGNILTNVLDVDSGLSINYERTSTYYDGTPMTDSKVDGKLYLKMKDGSGYVRQVLPNWGENFLNIDTMADLRALDDYNLLLVKSGYYKGVTLLGYYEKGDAPHLNYNLNIDLSSEDIPYIVKVNDSYFNIKNEIIDINNIGLDNLKPNRTYIVSSDYVLDNLTLPNNIVLIFNGGSLDIKQLNIDNLKVEGDVKLKKTKIIGSLKNKEINVSWWDKSDNNTILIQNLIDLCSLSNAKLKFEYKEVYKFKKHTSEKITILEGTSGISVGYYCCLLKDNVDIDFNESELIVDESLENQAILFLSYNYNNLDKYIHNIKLYNFKYKGINSDTTDNCSLITIVRGVDVFLNKATIDEPTWTPFRIMSSNEVYLGNMRISNGKQHHINVGNSVNNKCTNVTIENINSINCGKNPLIATIEDFSINNFKSFNSGWGWKVQNGSKRGNINNIQYVGGELSTNNSGVKIQGTDEDYCEDINITNIVCSNCHSHGLYIQYSKDCNIDNYVGNNNGIVGLSADVWVDGENINFGKINSKQPYIGFVNRLNSKNINIDLLNVYSSALQCLSNDSVDKLYINTINIYGIFNQRNLIYHNQNGMFEINNIYNYSNQTLIGVSTNSNLISVKNFYHKPTDRMIQEVTSGVSAYITINNGNYQFSTNTINSVTNRYFAPIVSVEQISGTLKPVYIQTITGEGVFRLRPLDGVNFTGTEVYVVKIGTNTIIN